jgi:hypothetical protein
MLASLVFLSPLGALAALAALAPAAAALAARRRVGVVRRGLGLAPPSGRADLRRLAMLTAGLALLGLAAAQPALTHGSTRRVRSDVQALFVFDTSGSMAASAGPTTPTRLDRAAAAAERLRAAIPDVESGVATLTDRILPELPPVADEAGFDGVVSRAVAIETPPPLGVSLRATSYAPLATIPTTGYFDPSAKRRIVVLLTDGESAPFDAGAVVRALAARPRTTLLAIRFWRAGESVYLPDGRRDPGYRSDPSGRALLDGLASDAGGRAFEESDLGAAARELRSRVGSGPTVVRPGEVRSRRALGPYLAALGAVLIAVATLWPSRTPRRSIRLSVQ